MQYLIVFLEGIITFISPCLLPMLPIYLSYFAGSATDDSNANKKFTVLKNALGFVLGFTIVFVSLGAFAGTVGRILSDYSVLVNIVSGTIVVIFGLNFMGVIKLSFLNSVKKSKANTKNLGFFSSLLFGIVFSVGWTPCVGAFLGSALAMAASSGGTTATGIIMLLCYSFGLAIPFILSAVVIDKLKSTFDFIKKHYKIINIISGALLIIVGILMMTGLMGYFLSFLSF